MIPIKLKDHIQERYCHEYMNEIQATESRIPDFLFFQRIPKMDMLRSCKPYEFKYILKCFTNETFDGDNWDSYYYCYSRRDEIEYESDYDENEKKFEDCICSENDLKHVYFIKHKRLGCIFQIGSSCVKKLSLRLYGRMVGKSCIYCGDFLNDRRKVYQKDGYCNAYCLSREQEKQNLKKRVKYLFSEYISFHLYYISCKSVIYEYENDEFVESYEIINPKLNLEKKIV